MSLSELTPPPRVGVIGAGQLAFMMGEEAGRAGVSLGVLATSPEDPAGQTADSFLVGRPDDLDALERLVAQSDVVTFDHELVDLAQLADLEARGALFRPSPRALRFAVDKAFQRRALRDAGVAVPRFVVVATPNDELDAFLDATGDDVVVKSATGGYDGRGVWFPSSRSEVYDLVESIAGEVVVEERLDLLAEVAQLVARDVEGNVALYPLVTTVQRDGMCAEVRYPAEVTASLAVRAEETAEQLASLIDVVGILAIEFFVTSQGLVVNEVALRPHNSGHWTIEGCTTSQFVNHLRAVSGQLLGATDPLAPSAVMVNLVGGATPSSPDAARKVPGVAVHDYQKAWRPGRKLGHVTATSDQPGDAHVRAWESARAYGTGLKETS